MNANLLKNYLMCYVFNTNTILNLKDQLKELETRQYDPPGGSVIKMPEGSSIPNSTRIIRGMELIDPIIKQIIHCQDEIDAADEFIRSLYGTEKELVLDKFVRRLSIAQMEDKYFCNNRQVWYKIDKLIHGHDELKKLYETG